MNAAPSAAAPPAAAEEDAREIFAAEWLAVERSLRRLLDQRLGDRAAVDDVLQEAALAAWRSRASRDPRRPFAPWAWGITRHCLAAWWRACARREAGPPVTALALTTPEEERPSLDPVLDLAAADLLLLRLVGDGLPHDEIGGRLGLSRGAIAQRLSRLRRRLRRRLTLERLQSP